MIKFFILSLLLLINMDARENPFFPSIGEKDLPTTSNKDQSLSPLKKATLSLPSSARVLQKVTLTYKNLDGSIEKRSIELQNSIDWHLPVFVSQSMGGMNIKNVSSQVKSSNQKKVKFKHLYSSKNVKFYQKNKALKILTNDKLIRSFLLSKPYRIVLDFKKDVNLKSEGKTLSSSIFKNISIGTHDGYYRSVILLDGQYKFTKTKEQYGYMLQLR